MNVFLISLSADISKKIDGLLSNYCFFNKKMFYKNFHLKESFPRVSI